MVLSIMMLSVGLLGIVFSAPPIVKHYTVPTEGHVHTIGINVYNDPNFTSPCTLVEWGWLNPGEQVTRTLYVFNDGNVPVTLTALAQNWQPMESPSYLNFTWDKEGALLDAAHGIPVVLTLTVALDIANTTISDFSFEVLMTGTQT